MRCSQTEENGLSILARRPPHWHPCDTRDDDRNTTITGARHNELTQKMYFPAKLLIMRHTLIKKQPSGMESAHV